MAHYVYLQIIRVGIVPDVFMVSIMVNAYCKDGRVVEAAGYVKKNGEFGC